MLIASFFEHLKRTKTLPEGKVFCFSSAVVYPLLFFHHLMSFYKRNGLIIQSLSCSNDAGALKAILSTMSFSGHITYWLEDFHSLSDKKQLELLQYLRMYDGPHRVLCFSDKVPQEYISKNSSDGFNIIELPTNITAQDFAMARFLVSEQLPIKSNFAAQMTMYADYLTLDSICLFAHYELVLGKNIDEFFTQWITRIIDPTSSFFILSQHFFSKKTKPFFRQWATVSEQYLPTFWVSFWTDQIWRSYMYCDLMKQKRYADAKKVQYKLPFSFINRDWSHYSLAELANAHQFLTTIDFKLKNGNSELGLEHFYNQFFENKF
jgi:hypothetical protein